MLLFLSYVRKEQEVIEAFAGRLRRAGFDVFLDTGLTGGQRWWDELIRQIQQCDGFVPILTQGYLLSRPCKLEAAYAEALKKPILPVQMDEISPRLLSPAIGDVQWVRYADEDVNTLLDLVKALNSLPASPQLPDPLPDPPPLPVSYMEQLVDRVDSEQELTRADQREMLIELKSRLGGDEDEDARELLRRLKRRTDLQYVIALDIDAALSLSHSIPHAPVDAPSEPVVPHSEPAAPEEHTDIAARFGEHSSRSDVSGLEKVTSDAGSSSETLSQTVLKPQELSQSAPPSGPPPVTPIAKGVPTSGEAGDGSRNRPGDDAHDRRRRPWLIGAAVGVVVLAVVGVILGLLGGGSSPPTPNPKPMRMTAMAFTGGMTVRMTAIDKTLEAHLDPDFRSKGHWCYGASHLGWDGEAKGAIICSWPHDPAISVTYVQIQSASAMEMHWKNYKLETAGNPKETANGCVSKPGIKAWQPDDNSRYLVVPEAATGHLLCFRPNGHPALVWTNDGRLNVIAEARANGLTANSLEAWWLNYGGLYEEG